MTTVKSGSVNGNGDRPTKSFEGYSGRTATAFDSSHASIEEIDKAVGAHGMWENRLKSAIDTGQSDVTP